MGLHPTVYRQRYYTMKLPTYENSFERRLVGNHKVAMSPTLKGKVAGIEPRIKGYRNRTDDNAATPPFLH